MKPEIDNINDFVFYFWNHYLSIEREFLNTKDFLEFDNINNRAYSLEYFKLYQIIGSEVDVVAKNICKICGNSNIDGMDNYCEVITNNFKNFIYEEIFIVPLRNYITPWEGWTYTKISRNNKIYNKANNPEWWKLYNKSKHERNTKSSNYEIEYYKLANQENIFLSLAGLYQLEIYLLGKVLENTEENDWAIKNSMLFKMKSFSNLFINKNSSQYIFNNQILNLI